MNRIMSTPRLHPEPRAAFTLTEVLVCMVVLTLLLALLFPALHDTVRRQKVAGCLSNLRSYGTALNLFIVDHGTLPWWDGQNLTVHNNDKADPSSSYPNFEAWTRPYLNYTTKSQRPRCPLGTKEELRTLDYVYNYAGNSTLCFTYPRVQSIPVPHSRVVLAAEATDSGAGFGYATHMNMAMWGVSEADGGNKSMDVEGFSAIKNSRSQRAAQYHGPDHQPGMNLFFLDGHVALVTPVDGNWHNPPLFSTNKTTGGLFYDRAHFNALKAGQVFP
jgi:prepilin-type N-terminal cleavage/methylation domain-containing protein/prepilin-type processing-associated H-X9-DG protein